MQGLGNDFILIDCRQEAFPPKKTGLQALSRRLCDRRFGIGADQILLLDHSMKSDFRMRILNADGSEVEMCGNGIRCLARYIWDNKLSRKRILNIETLAGIIRPQRAGNMVKVDMGEPVFEPGKIPVRLAQKFNSTFSNGRNTGVIDYPLKVADKKFNITCLSMGNPHTVIFVDQVAAFPVGRYGPLIETHDMFPRRTNVEFVEILNASEIKMRVWERGAGETMACGTGASAAAVASALKGLTGETVTVHLPGGALLIERASNTHVHMTGPAKKVFEGIADIS